MTTDDDKIEDVLRRFRVEMSDPKNVELAAEDVYEKLVDEVILDIAFDIHYSAKAGYLDLEDYVETPVEEGEVDIFGNHLSKKTQECVCPSCKHSMAASRFAPHLAKCMGMGRNSSRIASRRIANNSKDAYGGMISDDDDDADWTVGSDRRRKKRERNGTRRPKNQKTTKNGDASTVDVGPSCTSTEVSSSSMSYDLMTFEEKKNLLTQICGVISEHTKKLCTRSMRCPQHSDEQRRSLRAAVLSSDSGELLQVDVDTFDEADALARNWEQEHSNTSSPADSASTSSSSSKKREKLPKVKGKTSSKSHKGSPSFLASCQTQAD